jgi:hypothetical protein
MQAPFDPVINNGKHKLTSAPRQMTRPEKRMAAYIAAREIDARPVDDTLLQALRKGEELRHATQKAIRFGRANVIQDLKQTNNESGVIREAVVSIAEEVLPEMDRAGWNASLAGWSNAYGVGCCGEHAALAAKNIAEHLADGQTVEIKESKLADHAWSEWLVNGYRINVDAYCDGPVTTASDTRFARRRNEARLLVKLDSNSADSYQKTFQEVSTACSGRLKPQVRQRYDELVQSGYDPAQNDLWVSTPVINEKFARRVRNRIEYGLPPRLEGVDAIGQRMKLAKQRFLARFGTNQEIRDRAREKLSRHQHDQNAPTYAPNEWKARVRDAAYTAAVRMGIHPESAFEARDDIVVYARLLDAPSPRENLEIPNLDDVLGPSPEIGDGAIAELS